MAIGGPPPGPPPRMKGWMLERLDRELDLTAAQHARIDTVLTRREAALRALMSEGAPQLPRSQAPAERQARDPKQPPTAAG